MEAFFADLEERSQFVLELHHKGREAEAMLLCCCYLDGLANWLEDPVLSSHQAFVALFSRIVPDSFLGRIHVRHLRKALERRGGKKADAGLALLDKIDDGRLLSADEITEELPKGTQPTMVEWLRGELWRGTIASIAYGWLRTPAIHGLGASGAITFDCTTFRGGPVPKLDFQVLYDVLLTAISTAKSISLESGEWFGRPLRFADDD